MRSFAAKAQGYFDAANAQISAEIQAEQRRVADELAAVGAPQDVQADAVRKTGAEALLRSAPASALSVPEITSSVNPLSVERAKAVVEGKVIASDEESSLSSSSAGQDQRDATNELVDQLFAAADDAIASISGSNSNVTEASNAEEHDASQAGSSAGTPEASDAEEDDASVAGSTYGSSESEGENDASVAAQLKAAIAAKKAEAEAKKAEAEKVAPRTPNRKNKVKALNDEALALEKTAASLQTQLDNLSA